MKYSQTEAHVIIELVSLFGSEWSLGAFVFVESVVIHINGGQTCSDDAGRYTSRKSGEQHADQLFIGSSILNEEVVLLLLFLFLVIFEQLAFGYDRGFILRR